MRLEPRQPRLCQAGGASKFQDGVLAEAAADEIADIVTDNRASPDGEEEPGDIDVLHAGSGAKCNYERFARQRQTQRFQPDDENDDRHP